MAASTSAGFPFTVTVTGELTAAVEFDGNVSPGSTAGTVGPRPVAKSDKTSPEAAGFDSLTSVKSLEWVTAGPFGVVAI